MGAKADYTLDQAVAMYNLFCRANLNHWDECDQCVMKLWEGFKPFDDGAKKRELCERGQQIKQNQQKWIRRIQYAARREGKRASDYYV